MEEISSELKVSELKQASLCKAYETLRSEASAMLLLALQWKDLDEHFNSTRNSLEQRHGELVEREKSIREREKGLEAKDSLLHSEIESKSERLGEIERLIEARGQELESKGREIESKSKRLDEIEGLIEQRGNDFESKGREIELKSKHLDEIERLIEERGKKLELSERESESKLKRLDEIERLIDERSKELELSERESKSKHLDEIERLIDERGKVVESNKREIESLDLLIREKRHELGIVDKWMKEKGRDCDQLKFDIRERMKRLDSLDRCIMQRSEEADSKGKELGLVRGMLKNCREEFDFKERQFDSIRMSLEDHKRELELKEDQLIACRNSVHELNRDIRLREEMLQSIQNSIVNCSIQLELKKEQLGLVQKDLDLMQKEFNLKKRIFISLKKSVDECTHQFDMKETQLEGIVLKAQEMKEQSFGPEFEGIHSIHKEVNECLKEVELKEKSLLSFQRLVEERAIELEKKASQLEERVNEFALRQKELNLIQNLTDLGTKEKTDTHSSRVKFEQSENNHSIVNFPSFASYQYCTTNGHFLQLLLTEQLKRHDQRCSELFSVLQGSPDPAKLVLDAVQGFYPMHSSSEEMGFDLSIVRTSCILLLEKVMVASPEISPQVREAATKLASDWKAKMAMKTENRLEVMGFLQLIASYRLNSAFDGEEIRSLVDLVGQNRQESPFRRALCIADKAPVKMEQAGHSMAVVPSPNLAGKDLTQDDILTALQMPDPAKHVLGIVKGSFSQLWKRRDHVGFETSFMKSYIFIFEQLLRNSPEIQIDVKQDAMKLAIEWGDRVRANKTEISLEVLGFLLFLAAYGLVSFFNEDDISSFLEMISQNKHVLEQSQTLSLAYKIDVFVQNLIGRKKHVAAVRLAYAFKLTDKFLPVKLLTEHVEEAKSYSRQLCDRKNSIDGKDEATDCEIAALRSVVQCVEDHNLKSEFPADNVTKRIALLEKIKRDRRQLALFFKATDEHPQHQQPTCNKRKKSTTAPPNEQPQQQQQQEQTKKKRPRKALSTAKPRASAVSKPVPQLMTNSSTDLQRTDLATVGNSVQFDLNDMPA